MMRAIRSSSGRSLFLLEIVLLFSFFLISVLICTGLFLFSAEKSEQAEALSNASIQSVSIADTIKACGSNIQQAKSILGADNNFNLYYDQDWQTGREKVYYAHVDYTISNNLLTAEIQFFRLHTTSPVFQMEIKEYLEVEK